VTGVYEVEVVEGATRLIIPSDHSKRGPGRRNGGAFFNSQMGFNRDVSISLLRSISPQGWEVLDAMAGTGARGVRIANEAGDGIEVHINDSNPEAHAFIKKNIILNHLDNAHDFHRDLRCLLTENVYHYIDIDPFGSPVPYLQAGIDGCRRRGMIGITATDTAPLAGIYPKKCVRRYGAMPCRCRFGHEVGLRILIGHIVREAAKFDRGVEPVLCFYADHFFRIHLRMTEGGGRADHSLKELVHIDHDHQTGERMVNPSIGRYGPLWGGSLFDHEVLDMMESSEDAAHGRRLSRFLEVCKEELDVPLFYESDEIGHLMGGSPPSLESIIQRLEESGRASRTHFSPTGFKTDLTLQEVKYLLKDMV
jgi:tRNA (guanine26-N2/guanine27-N2)-dimethyltransferase